MPESLSTLLACGKYTKKVICVTLRFVSQWSAFQLHIAAYSVKRVQHNNDLLTTIKIVIINLSWFSITENLDVFSLAAPREILLLRDVGIGWKMYCLG